MSSWLPRFTQDHPGLSRSCPVGTTVCPGVAPVFYIDPSRFTPVVLNISYPGSARFATGWRYGSISVRHGSSNLGDRGSLETGTVRTCLKIRLNTGTRDTNGCYRIIIYIVQNQSGGIYFLKFQPFVLLRKLRDRNIIHPCQ